MIRIEELNLKGYPTTPEQDRSMARLLEALNVVRKEWGKPMIVTSGLRSMEDQMRINPKAPRSKHLNGEAADLRDDGSLYKWLHEHPEVMEKAGLWGEIGTSGWVHLQCVPFGSWKEGKPRWFVA